jgi:hypothetical protein
MLSPQDSKPQRTLIPVHRARMPLWAGHGRPVEVNRDETGKGLQRIEEHASSLDIFRIVERHAF